MKGIIHLLLIVSGCIQVMTAQDVNLLMDSVIAKIDKIESYKVTALFHVDIAFVNMPDKTATIHYRAPDKIEVDSDGFLMIPKMGMKPVVTQFEKDKFLSVYQGKEQVNEKNCHVVTLIPNDKRNKIVLSTLWIRQDDFLVTRMELYTRKAGRIQVDLFYTNEILPSAMIFTFEVGGMNIPLKYFGNEIEINQDMMTKAEDEEGKVTIIFSNYVINYIDGPAKGSP
jgi:outer membrane lipoprotein-sorting protein